MRIAPELFRFGIRQKMVLVLLCVLTVALGTTSWLTIRQQEDNVLRETRQHGDDVARIVSQALAFSIVGYDYHTVQLLLDEIVQSHDIGYAKVLSRKGNVMAESGSPPESGKNWIMFTQDVVFDHKTVGLVVIGLNNQKIIDRLQGQRSSIISREAIIIILIVLGEFLALSYVIMRPVSIISRSLDMSVDETGKIASRIPLSTSDEFGKVAAQFNEMREQLNQANSRLQSKIESADARLTDNNRKLLEQATELQRMNETLQHMAITDSLTGLHNRRYFESVAESDLALSIRHGDTNSILLIDVDRFKRINDTWGHRAGDDVLIDIAGVLNTALRKTDLVCRMGGEEFILLCRHTDKQEAMMVAEKIRSTIAGRAFTALGQERISVTVSIGVVTFPGSEAPKTVGEYIHRADLALYESKTSGRNRVTFYAAAPAPEGARRV
jgi:diguanylate cyclase (GGDEF)-like protein